MSSAFDWIVEHETLPPNEPGLGGQPGGREPRRLPWWAWPTIIVLVLQPA